MNEIQIVISAGKSGEFLQLLDISTLEKPISQVELCDQRILDLLTAIANFFKIFEANAQ